MRADRRSDDVVRVADVRHPVADRLVGRVLQGLAAGFDRGHGGAEQSHLVDVDRLPGHILDAHVDLAGQAELRADGGDRHPVLAGAGLGDDPQLAHPAGEQHLAQGIVDLVGAGVAEVLALQPDACATGLRAEPVGAINGRRAATEGARQLIELATKAVVVLGCLERGGQLFDRRHQRLGNELPAVATVPPAGIGQVVPPPLWGRVRVGGTHVSTPRTASTKARNLWWSLRPGSASTPLQTSTPHGRRRAMASATLPGFNPPATRIG